MPMLRERRPSGWQTSYGQGLAADSLHHEQGGRVVAVAQHDADRRVFQILGPNIEQAAETHRAQEKLAEDDELVAHVNQTVDLDVRIFQPEKSRPGAIRAHGLDRTNLGVQWQ